MNVKVSDFLYENGEMLNRLVGILKEDRNFENIDPITLRIYKLLIAVDQLTTDATKNYRINKKNILSLKNEALRLMPMENLVFFEKVTIGEDKWYFYNYLSEEIKKPEVRLNLYSFARATAQAS